MATSESEAAKLFVDTLVMQMRAHGVANQTIRKILKDTNLNMPNISSTSKVVIALASKYYEMEII